MNNYANGGNLKTILTMQKTHNIIWVGGIEK